MITNKIMSKQQLIRINYIEKISFKSDAKKIKYYHISKHYCNLLASSLAMITQFLQMSMKEILMLLYQKKKIIINYIEAISIKN